MEYFIMFFGFLSDIKSSLGNTVSHDWLVTFFLFITIPSLYFLIKQRGSVFFQQINMNQNTFQNLANNVSLFTVYFRVSNTTKDMVVVSTLKVDGKLHDLSKSLPVYRGHIADTHTSLNLEKQANKKMITKTVAFIDNHGRVYKRKFVFRNIG